MRSTEKSSGDVRSPSSKFASFDAFNLVAPLRQAIAALGFETPTDVQQKTIPAALNGGDWMVSSQTGSGKTAAFLLPALEHILKNPPAQSESKKRGGVASPAVLVLAPTRELAQQVADDAIDLVRFCKGVRIASVVGGTSYFKQTEALRGASLVVATPGRLLDLHRNRQISLDKVDTLIVDEADRMLDLGFSEDLEAIHQATEARARTLMFSATFAPRIMALAENVMREPKKIALAHAGDTHKNIAQTLHWCDDNHHKDAVLDHYLNDPALVQAVVFTSTQIETDALSDALREAGHRATALHGGIPQAMRNRRISALREGAVQVLVATDVAARGIDVPAISHVINYGLPMKSEDYIHRIGRTGRAGRDGIAITLATARDRFKIRDIERLTQQKIDESELDGLEPTTKPWSDKSVRAQRGRPSGDGRAARSARTPRADASATTREPRPPRVSNETPRSREGNSSFAPRAYAERAERAERAPSRARADFDDTRPARAPRAAARAHVADTPPKRYAKSAEAPLPKLSASGASTRPATSERKRGPAHTPPAAGGNRAARRAALQNTQAAIDARARDAM